MKNKKLYLLISAFVALFAIMLPSCSLIVSENPTNTSSLDANTEKSTNEIPTVGPGADIPTQPKPTESDTDAPPENNTGSNTTPPSEDDTGSVITPPSEDISAEIALTFYETEASISDSTAIVNTGKIYKIVKPGTYIISGKMSDGQIQVEVAKTEKVTLVLNNFDGSCSDSAVIYVISADKVSISLAENSVNMVTDAQTYVFSDPTQTKPNACIYSTDDLTIKGKGTLYVNGRYNNGIGTKNDLEVKNCSVYVSAVKNALKGNDSVTICGNAVVNVEYAKDAVKSDTTAVEKPGKGFVTITDTARVNVSCNNEAVQATQNITITSGAILNVIKARNAYKCDGTTNIDAGCIVTQ